MKKLLSLLLLILIGCSSPEPINMNEMLNKRDDVYYTKDTNKPYSGPVFSLYENGQLEVEGTLKNGISDESFKVYYKNGRLKQEGTYNYGKRDGLWRLFWNQEDGQLKEEGTFKNGIPDGFYKSYNYKGLPRREVTYKDGKEELSVEFFYRNIGNIDGKKVNGKWDGLQKSYYGPGGELRHEKNFKDGELNGSFKYYYLNGTLKEIGTFKDGKLDGRVLEYYENGQLKEERIYKNGNLFDYETFLPTS